MCTPHFSVYLSLGGNLENSLQTLQNSLKEIASIPNVKIVKISRFYQTAPVGNKQQPDFINLACHLSTSLSPKALQHALQCIEIKMGKTPKPRNAPRIIDIDLLFYESLQYHDIELEIPHPRWKERLFVLIPLLDLISEITLNESGHMKKYFIQDLIALLDPIDQTIVRISMENNAHLY